MSSYYKEKRIHHIYAMIEQESKIVYVGKTTVKKPFGKKREILNGKIRSIEGEFSEKSEFVILESVSISKAEAFSHVLAWYLFFENNGFKILSSTNEFRMIEFPKSKTLEIYNEVCMPYNIEEVISRKVHLLLKEEENNATEFEEVFYTQLNIRVEEDVADSFRNFAKERSLTQNDAMKILLSERDSDMKKQLVKEKNLLTEELQKSKEMLEQQRKKKNEEKERAQAKNKTLIDVLKNSINCFTEYLLSSKCEDEEKIKLKRIKNAEGKKAFHSCSYPDSAGCCVATLKEIIVGKNKKSILGKYNVTYFLIFEKSSGEKFKLRLFEKKNFNGCYPLTYGYKDSLWIVGYILSDDGGVNIVSGIPVDSMLTDKFEKEKGLHNDEKKASLDEVIYSIKNFSL